MEQLILAANEFKLEDVAHSVNENTPHTPTALELLQAYYCSSDSDDGMEGMAPQENDNNHDVPRESAKLSVTGKHSVILSDMNSAPVQLRNVNVNNRTVQNRKRKSFVLNAAASCVDSLLVPDDRVNDVIESSQPPIQQRWYDISIKPNRKRSKLKSGLVW
ncbi:hypothetical protein HA402_009269 [Bradysia odoriphaga]|nr:hypothetical protein HA402_009269 [Bradysia odoriphaga]